MGTKTKNKGKKTTNLSGIHYKVKKRCCILYIKKKKKTSGKFYYLYLYDYDYKGHHSNHKNERKYERRKNDNTILLPFLRFFLSSERKINHESEMYLVYCVG